MGKKSAATSDSVLKAAGNLRAIPPVDRILGSEPFAALIEAFGRAAVKDVLAAFLDQLRSRDGAVFVLDAIAGDLRSHLERAQASSLRRVINATGILIHTNLGRSPIDAAIWAGAQEIVAGYSNLELDLEEGGRGSRDEHLSTLAAGLFGCEAAILTNNNAGGTMLLVAALAAKREVLVSRGELVEIGGAFRIPDVIEQGGAKLREVGTTNRTRAADYADAATRRTAALLRVHRSNFDIVGFTETPSVEELVEVARKKKVPMLYDEGSGRIVDLSRYGFGRAPTLKELIASGVDAISCSTDKLIGATQGGLILGRADIIERCRRHPLMRALRAGKESYAVVGETLKAFARGREEKDVALYRMLATSIDELRGRAATLVVGTTARIVETQCALGGGTTPTETIPSIGVAVPGSPDALARRFRSAVVPILGRVVDDRFTLDLRTIAVGELQIVKGELGVACEL